MPNYTSTQRFVRLTNYLLLEYNYTTAPTPEQYFVNTGTPSVGFEKIVNGYFNNAVQITNRPQDKLVTNNIRDLSVVQVEKNRFVTLDNDYLVPYLDTDPKLTSVANLPVVFPSNIGVYYDTVKFHLASGYNFGNLDGIILQTKFQERTGKKATITNILVTKSDVDLPVLNPNPIYLGGVLYDHYVEVKIPNYSNMVYEFDILSGNPAQAGTLAAKISSDGYGFLKDAPIEFTLYEVTQTSLKNGYENYIAQIRAQLPIPSADNYSSLSAIIQENSFYNYLEYYPTWNGNFLEDFINAEGSVGNSYYVIHDIELKEQVGLNYITTFNFTSTQTQDYNSAYIFRPVLVNPLTTSFVVNYTMRLVNRSNQNQIIRRSSFSSFNVAKYGREVNKINLTTGAYAQKVYNKIVQAASVVNPYGVAPSPGTPVEKKVPVFYKDNNIAITKETIVIDRNGNLVSETSLSGNTQIYGQGKAKIVIDPFDNFYKFTVYDIKRGTTPQIIDLGTSLTYYIVFLDKTGQSVRVENIKNITTVSNPSAGQLAFKVVDSNSKKVLGFTSREFYIISRTPDGIETKLYSGTWQTQSEFVASGGSTGITSGTTGETAGTTGTTGNSVTTVTNVSTEGTSTVTGAQIVSGVPLSLTGANVITSSAIYNIGSSSILNLLPTNLQNTTGGFVSSTGTNANTTGSSIVQTINITALADSISGKEAQGLVPLGVVNFYFTPGSPGAVLFKGLKPSQFLEAALKIHPKINAKTFDPIYIQYCNILQFPISPNPMETRDVAANQNIFKK